MKLLILSTLFFSSLTYAAVSPQSGLYVCVNGNEDSICDQILRPYITGGKLTAIKVEYVGHCGSMGPYTYYCQNDVCEDAGLRFDFKDSRNYHWTNKQYGFHCDFKKK